MRLARTALLTFVALTAAGAQTPDLLLSDRRLTVHTLVREDIFAGLLDDRMDRMSRAERNIEALLKERPEERGNLLAWRGAIALYYAVVAHEAGNPDEFERHFARAREDFANAAAAQSGNDGVAAVTGGSFAVLADRLPQQSRAAAWSQAYDAYALLWKQQGAAIEELPVHLKGEVLAGLTVEVEARLPV